MANATEQRGAANAADETPQEKIGRNVFALGFVSLFNDTASEMMYPYLPRFVALLVKGGAAAAAPLVGIIEGVAETVASLTKLVSGYASDRLRKRKRLVTPGYTLSALSRPLIGLAVNWWHVFALRSADRLGKGVRTAPRDALIADSVAPEKRGVAFGIQRALDHTGGVLGPIAASVLMAFVLTGDDAISNLRRLFMLAGIPAMLALLVLLVFVREKARAAPVKPEPVSLKLGPFSGTFKFYLAVIVVFALGNSSDAFLFLVASSELGLRPALLPLLLVLMSAAKMVSSVPAGWLSDRIGRRWVIVAGYAVYVLAYLGFAFVGARWQLWVLFGVYGLHHGLTEGVEKAFVADLVPAHLRGSAYGLYTCAVGIAALPASIVFGLLWKLVGRHVPFVVGAALALVASAMLLALKIQPSGDASADGEGTPVES